jgi:anti-sigma regulatory factor (Ser/Thr protein kinase)
VHRAAERWEHPYRVAGRVLTTEIAAGIVPADILTSARAAAIDTVLDVLLDNALVHGTGRVGVRLEFVLVAPVIWIEDEGTFAGDDPTEQPYDAAETPGQHGYGMRIAHALADAEGARVHLAKREPTTFELILPAPGE